ncbi:hypothetical protein ACLOJK_028051 [Asimina triloba]
MGKTSPKESSAFKQKRRQRNNSRNTYLKPGALAQLRYSRVTTRLSCTDIGKKRVLVLGSEKVTKDLLLDSKVSVDEHGLSMLSPERKSVQSLPTAIGLMDGIKEQKLPATPRTPRLPACDSESRLESLPIEILARQLHFNYTTPDRSRQEMLRARTPVPTEHWPFISRSDGKGGWVSSPHTPKAPKHGPRPPSRLNPTEMRQIAAVLFQESKLHSRCKMPPGLPKPPFKSLASLFYEEELCQAVAQNKLR